MDLLWGIWEIIVNCVECFLLYYLLNVQLGIREKRKILTILSTFGLVAVVSAFNLSGVDYKITMTVAFIIKLAYALLFESGLVKKLFWGCVGGFTAVIANSLIAVVIVWISGIDINETLIPGESRFAVTLLYCIIVVILCWIFARFHSPKEMDLPLLYQVIMLIVMLLGLYAATETISMAIQIELSKREVISYTAIVASILFMMIAMIVLFEKMGRVIYDKLKAETRLKQIELEEENNKRIETIVKTWRHDFHNYLEVIRIYIENKNYDQLKKYLGETRQDFQHVLSMIATGNPAIDAIISSKLLISYNKNIDVKLNIKKIDKLPITETKMCVLIGNLFDNAIEACEKISDENARWLKIDITNRQGMLYLNIENSSDGEYRFEENKLLSNKHSENHGFGLVRISQIVSEANGICDIVPMDEKFIVSIFLPL